MKSDSSKPLAFAMLILTFPAAFTAAQDEKPKTISEAYFSEAEGRKQGFQVVLPPGYSAENRYPLFVQMFGSASMLPTRERPFIRIRPSGRGVWGYRAMSRYDILQAIRRTKEAYSVNADRVYITGTSAGATGIMHTVAQRPDVFAAAVPLVAFGNDLPLENFRNVGLRCEHGVNDWTSAICNVRVQFQKLKKLGYEDAILNEHPTAGHGVRTPPPKTMEWLFSRKRDPSTRHIVYSCENPRDGRAYWLTIERFTDPHEVARIEAKADSDGITVSARNITRFSIDLIRSRLAPGQPVTINGKPAELLPFSNFRDLTRLYFTRKENGTTENWQGASTLPPFPDRRIYAAGAAGNLFQGEPLMVIYGTGGDAKQNAFLQQAAGILARSGGPPFRAASVRFPIHADSKLEDVPLENANLMIIGTPETNSLLARLAPKLPYSIQDGAIHAGDRKPLSLDGSVLGFHYFNPEHPKRLIYVVSPYLNELQEKQFLKNPREFLAGGEGFKMIDQPDLLVRGSDLKLRREMQLGHDWKFRRYPGADQLVSDDYSDRLHLAVAHLKVMRNRSESDFALWWGPEDKGLFGGYDFNWLTGLDPTSYTLADYAVRRRETETLTGSLPGDQLQDIYRRWIGPRELITWPELSMDDIDPEGRYRIVIPMDMVPKLGIRRKVLESVSPGPNVIPKEVASELASPKN